MTTPTTRSIDLDQAACHPWTGSHDSRQLTETNQQWDVRHTIAKAICTNCPVNTDCLALVKDYRARRIPMDGIFVGHHFRYGGDTT